MTTAYFFLNDFHILSFGEYVSTYGMYATGWAIHTFFVDVVCALICFNVLLFSSKPVTIGMATIYMPPHGLAGRAKRLSCAACVLCLLYAGSCQRTGGWKWQKGAFRVDMSKSIPPVRCLSGGCAYLKFFFSILL